MTNDSERNEFQRVAADLDKTVLRAREAVYNDDAIRREIAYLMAKVEDLRRRHAAESDRTP